MPIWDRRQQGMNTKKMLLTKRRRFVLVSFLLSLGLLIVQRLPVESRYLAIVIFALVSYVFSAWSLVQDLRGVNWIVQLILPTFYPVAVALFYFLLPQALLTRIIVAILFAISMYALLLTANIFVVASARTIQLLRAARAVGFLLSILTSAFLFHVIFSLHVTVWMIGLFVFIVVLPILWQEIASYVAIASVKKGLLYAIIGAVVMSEVAIALSFWFIDVPLASVVLAMAMYVVSGFFQHELEDRLFQRTTQEYVGFALIVFVVVTSVVVVQWMH